MKSIRRFGLGLAVVLLALTTAAAAATNYTFQLQNKTTKYTITGFQTYENGTWSTWSGVNLAPGQEATMNWGANEGDCVVPFRVIYAEVQTEQYQVDWCKVHNIVVTDTDVTYN
jgi:hypothetical protein